MKTQELVGTRTRVMILYSYETSNHCMKHCCRTYLLEYYPHMLPHHHHALHCTTPCLAPARTPRTPPVAYRRVRILWLLNVNEWMLRVKSAPITFWRNSTPFWYCHNPKAKPSNSNPTQQKPKATWLWVWHENRFAPPPTTQHHRNSNSGMRAIQGNIKQCHLNQSPYLLS